MNSVVVFDLDGVITSEKAYWMTAGLVLHELLYSPLYWNIGGASTYETARTAEQSRRISSEAMPLSVIVGLKARSVNSNWDTCYAGVCVCLIDLLASLSDCVSLLPLQPWDSGWIMRFREQLSSKHVTLSENVFQRLDDPMFHGYVGLELINRFDTYASEALGRPVEEVFGRYSRSWKFCANLFQEWYLGDDLYTQDYGHPPVQPGKPGCIQFEEPLLSVEQLQSTLKTLCEQGYILGVATGRPNREARQPLKNYGLYQYFDEQRIVTHAEVALAEIELRSRGDAMPLVKPHPYQFLRAADPAYKLTHPLPPRGSFVVVGDSTSDVLGAHAANALVVAVLTGALTQQARMLLEQSRPDFIVEDITKVPDLLNWIDDLSTIQRLQFTKLNKAESLLQRWFALHMDLRTEHVTLAPKPVSLNSFNGVYQIDGKEYFFKTHVEEQGTLEEYYHAEFLHSAGYNIVRPLHTMHEKDRQMVIYPVVRWPVMFDLMRTAETSDLRQTSADLLVMAEMHECMRLLSIYDETLTQSTEQEHARAPIHQLFWHRLTGGRLKSFYEGKFIPFPSRPGTANIKDGIVFDDLLDYQWTINGRAVASEVTGEYLTLGELIERGKVMLNPARATATVIGHGDAHFGNVFLEEQQRYLYFDPAFAGRHSPLLDIVKPLFHNVFATWMYFSKQVTQDLQLSVAVQSKTITIEHNYELTPVRQAILRTKLEYLLKPLVTLLRSRNMLPADWAEVIRLALMCCPLLTINLLDEQRVSASVCWLGLSQVMQMGNFSLVGE